MHYDTTYNPAFPAVMIRIRFNHRGRNVQFNPFVALIDTGADRTCIPESAMPPEVRHYQTALRVRYADGKRLHRRGVRLPDAVVDLQDRRGNWISGKLHPELIILIQNGPQLLGRDIFNLHTTRFDGPARVCDIA